MKRSEQHSREKQPYWLAPAAVAAAGLLALTGCSEGSNDSAPKPTASESIFIPDEHESGVEQTPPETAESPEIRPSNSWPAEATIQAILKRGCDIATEQERKQYPNMWGNGLTEVSNDFDEAYDGKAGSYLFDMKMADFCPPYARLTDHGAG